MPRPWAYFDTSVLLKRYLPDHAAILGRLQRDRVHWELVDATRTILARAEQLAGGQGLRALDALHVAAALEFETPAVLRVPFITADRRQRRRPSERG
jgi:predicted nucleic acid-binding protein